mmetsp:Transcript_73957/g.178899  ORF Transcript_73957/g.178899 Transcript_73957/m.178899 type:complete len:512 (-) Transcript_73957:210-1745(-)
MAKHARVVSICFFSAIGSFLFGLDMGYIGPILVDDEFKRDVAHMTNWDMPDSEIADATSGLIVSVFAVGCMFSAFPLVSSYFVEVLGRKLSLMVGAVVFLIGSAIQASAGDVPVIVVGRFVSGCSIGILSTVVPLYQSELAPSELRGALTALSQVMICFGIVVASFADQVLLPLHGGWRLAVLLPVIPGLILLTGMPFLPRSPRWLVSKGRTQDAFAVLSSIRAAEVAQAELQEIMADHAAAQASGADAWRELFSGRVVRLLAVGVALQVLQQLTGINAFVSYGPRIFKSLGFSATLFQTILSLVLFFGTVPAMYLVERCGRRSLLASGAVGMLLPNVLMAVLGVIFTRQVDGLVIMSSRVAGGFIAGAVFFFTLNFTYSWGPTTWVYCAEIFPLKVRGRCVGLTTMAEWTGVFLVNQFTPMLLSAIDFRAFFVFGAFSLAAVALALWLPETKGVSLEHMGQVFDAKLGGAPPKEKDAAAGLQGCPWRPNSGSDSTSDSESSNETSSVESV